MYFIVIVYAEKYNVFVAKVSDAVVYNNTVEL